MSLVVDAGVTLEDFTLDVSLALPEGETIAVVGPNGAGKSTLVALLAGLVRPARGSIRLADRTLDDGDRHLPAHRRNIGVAFQDRRLFPSLTALENVAFPLRARGMRAAEARERARAVLGRMGVGDRAGAKNLT